MMMMIMMMMMMAKNESPVPVEDYLDAAAVQKKNLDCLQPTELL